MNICFISYGHISKTRGGIDRVTDTLARSFIEKGNTISMVSVWNAIESDIIEPYQFFLPSKELVSAENIEFLKRFFLDRKIDIIINQSEHISLFELLLASHFNIPIITVIHTDPCAIVKSIKDKWDKWKYENGIVKFFLKIPYFILRRIYQNYSRTKHLRYKYSLYYKNCNGVVLLSERFKPSFCKLACIKDQSKLYAIANPMTLKSTNISSNKDKIILYVGRLDFSPKRVDRLINIWDSIKDKKGWKVIIIGDGPYKEFYENMCKDKNILDIEFLGQLDPFPYYKKASILCLTSTHEGFGLVLTEALRNEVIPIVYGSYDSVYDIINNNVNGYIIKPFSYKIYRNVLEEIMNNRQKRELIKENICKQNELDNNFNLEEITNKWLKIMKEIVDNVN